MFCTWEGKCDVTENDKALALLEAAGSEKTSGKRLQMAEGTAKAKALDQKLIRATT